MQQKDKRYFRSLEEKLGKPGLFEMNGEEFGETPDVEAENTRGWNRRSFLKASGFAFAGAWLAGCARAPIKKAIPYLVKPEEVLPGQATWYASLCGGCEAGCGILAKNRDGRPIKLEGNPEHPLSRGGLCAVGQAAVLELYDSKRLQAPRAEGKESSWSDVDSAVIKKLTEIGKKGGSIRVLTSTVNSPTTRRAIKNFLKDFSDGQHVEFDPLSASALLDAHEKTHGKRAVPHFRFDQARVIVGFDADFLGTWISPVEYAAAYRAGRKLEVGNSTFSRHIHFESRMSLTGSNADTRVAVSPFELSSLVAELASLIAQKAGVAAPVKTASHGNKALQDAAEALWSAPGKGLVVCGVNDVSTQILVNFINETLGNYGNTLDLEKASLQKKGSDSEARALIGELASGKVDALLVEGFDPMHAMAGHEALGEALKRAGLIISFNRLEDDFSGHAHFVCPEPHSLECWSDAEAVEGTVTLGQPAIRRLGDTRTMAETLSLWSGVPQSDYELIRSTWKSEVYSQFGTESFEAFWNQSVHEGFSEGASSGPSPTVFQSAALLALALPKNSGKGELALVLYPKVGMLDGRHAHNPWLQELPDPISKMTWDNYAALAPETAERLGISEGDVVKISVKGESSSIKSFELPTQIQIGQDKNTVAVALGYGVAGTDRFSGIGPQWIEARSTVEAGQRVGENAAAFLDYKNGAIQYAGLSVTLETTGGRRLMAATQTHHTLTVPEGLMPPGQDKRTMIHETTLGAFHKNPASGNHEVHKFKELWKDDFPYEGVHWGMAIDLTACTGCSACVVACQAENNVPVVGKDEVHRRREMHWIRIDRYFAETDEGTDTAFQPMLCAQCDNAPCETVCPVLATVHSDEGLNQQIYNRCVGTRYCANNCPYKVRRFNWFNYRHDDPLENMVLNPDVTIRTRGIMEKCTFCVQRIQQGKADAKSQGRGLQDGDIRTACQQSCPADAIVFGDTNDPESKISKHIENPRHYRLLEEINVRPSLGYLSVVRNRTENAEHEEDTHHG